MELNISKPAVGKSAVRNYVADRTNAQVLEVTITAQNGNKAILTMTPDEAQVFCRALKTQAQAAERALLKKDSEADA